MPLWCGPTQKGFFIASDSGHVALFVRTEENNQTTGNALYDFIRKWQSPALRGVKVLAMAISPGEDFVAVAGKNNNIGLVHTKSIGLN